MRQFSYTIKTISGLHAALLAQEVRKYESFVSIGKGAAETDAAKLMKVMAMLIGQGDTVTVRVEGDDEEEAFRAIKAFFERYL